MDLPQLPARGPQAAASSWVRQLLGRAHTKAWRSLDDGYREALATAWATQNDSKLVALRLDPQAVAQELAATAPLPHLWPQCVAFLDTITDEVRAFAPPERFGWAAGDRPVAPDHEAVLLVDTRETGVGGRPTATVVRACTFVMRRVADEWRVAGFHIPEGPRWRPETR